MILDCAGGKCSCVDMVAVSDWERRGTCVAKNDETTDDAKKKEFKDENIKSLIRNKPKLNSYRIIFPTDVAPEREEEELFAYKKLEY